VPGMPVGFSMPAFPVLTSEELAALTTYIRNAWGNDASTVTAAQAAAAAKQRPN
jgi:mono/diheme cytochrome c family protein